MKIYGLLNIITGGLLGLTAMAVSLLQLGHGRAFPLAICMALSSVALFLGGTIFFVAGCCCQSRAAKAEECE